MSDTEVVFHRLPFSYYAHGRDYASNCLLWCVHSMDSCHSWIQSPRMNPILMEVFNADSHKLCVQVVADELAICSHFSVFDDSSFTFHQNQDIDKLQVTVSQKCNYLLSSSNNCYFSSHTSWAFWTRKRIVKMCILLLISELLLEAYLIKKIAEFWASAYMGMRKFIKVISCVTTVQAWTLGILYFRSRKLQCLGVSSEAISMCS